MLNLPDAMMAYLLPFAPLCTRRTWRHVPLLVVGAILAPGRRMVSSILRVTGHGEDAAFATYHRVLNRAVWSSLGASRILRGLLIGAFAPDGPLVLGIDETLERRRGPKIGAACASIAIRSARVRHFATIVWLCAFPGEAGCGCVGTPTGDQRTIGLFAA